MKLNYFNFKQINGKYLITNDLGCHHFLEKEDVIRLIHGDELDPDLAGILKQKGFLICEDELIGSDEYFDRLRNMKRSVLTATTLHIFVVTTRCNMRCVYCQANNGECQPDSMMSTETARKAVDLALQSPEQTIGFEFQGGEPLINFPVIKEIVEYSEQKRGSKMVTYSLVSNLQLLTDEMIEFFKRYNMTISTSIDGPEFLHDRNRPKPDGSGTWKKTADGINRLRRAGIAIGAIQTTTRFSLPFAKEIVETYQNLGINTIFVRPLTPLGKAAKYWNQIGYTPEEYLEFYFQVLDEIRQKNSQSAGLTELMEQIFLQRIFEDPVNYMELRSPCGAGIGQLAYFTDGNVFTCDEGRMVYEMGDDSFCLGNVNKDTYQDIIQNSSCRSVCLSSILESTPSCCDCPYQPYCGTCPVVNFAMEGDLYEKRPNPYRCQINKGILDYIFRNLQKTIE